MDTKISFFLQDVRLITLKSYGSPLHYKPGDVYNIRPRNNQDGVNDLFSIFEEHHIDIKPYYKLLVEQCHEGKVYSIANHHRTINATAHRFP